MEDNTTLILGFLILGIVILGIGGMVYLEDQKESILETCQTRCYFPNNEAELELSCLLSCHEKFSLECSESEVKK